ncbi:RNA-binding protein cabeza-like, partial [Frankliniella occidentalis]|uniref:RNA-binding protein cabeza-like n=1 Tax=Frankliniella occidentalis TaxID=133901 RepID=A0A9C6XAI7_FRAOC
DQEDDEDGFKPSFNKTAYGGPPPAQHLVVNTSSSGTPRTSVYRGNPPEYEDRARGTTQRPTQRNGNGNGNGNGLDAGCYFSPTPLATQDNGGLDGCGNGGSVGAGAPTGGGGGGGGGSRGRSPSLSIAPACGPKWCRSKLFGILGILLMVALAVIAALILHAE